MLQMNTFLKIVVAIAVNGVNIQASNQLNPFWKKTVNRIAIRNNTSSKTESACGALLRVTRSDWRLDCHGDSHLNGTPNQHQSSEISKSPMPMGYFENSLSPGGNG